jgi:hypothetical protein
MATPIDLIYKVLLPSISTFETPPGLAHLYNLVPYQRRAKHAGQCGVEVEGGKVPTQDWLLNL